MIPELVSGVQFSKGPYVADQGDFATAGAANINYVNSLDRPIVRVVGGDEGFARAVVASTSSTPPTAISTTTTDRGCVASRQAASTIFTSIRRCRERRGSGSPSVSEREPYRSVVAARGRAVAHAVIHFLVSSSSFDCASAVR